MCYFNNNHNAWHELSYLYHDHCVDKIFVNLRVKVVLFITIVRSHCLVMAKAHNVLI